MDQTDHKTIFDCVAEAKSIDELTDLLKSTIGLNRDLTEAFRKQGWALHEAKGVLNPRRPDVSRQFAEHAAKKDTQALRVLRDQVSHSRTAYVKDGNFFNLLAGKSMDPIASIMISQYTSYLHGGAAESLSWINQIRDQINKPQI